jgi:hypothetical protein
MAACGPATVHCTACGASYDLPLQATLAPAGEGTVALAITIDEPDVILLKTWAQSHRGPLVTA